MTKCLSFHAAYRCRHSGACCRAGWSIPFDHDERETIHALRLTGGSLTSDGVAERHDDGTCTFFMNENGLCAIHHAGGHFCPTAVALLFEPGESWPPVGIVDAPPALTNVGALDGLDARDAWPPLLRSGVMMDLDSYGAWERLGVELLAREGIAPGVSLDALAVTTDRIAS